MRSFQSRRDLLQLPEKRLPALQRAAERLPLVGPKAALLHLKTRAAVRRCKRERHHALEVEGGIVAHRIPAIRERPVWFEDEHFAVQRAIRQIFAAELERVTNAGFEV